MKISSISRVLSAMIFILGAMPMPAQSKIYEYNKDGSTEDFNVADVDSISYINPFTEININPSNKTGEVSPLHYGVCMEDVNHELYGGIWSQMIYGESFAEPGQPSTFRPIDQGWSTEDSEDGIMLVSESSSAGPKIMFNNTSCTVAEVSVDVYREGATGWAGFITKVTDPKVGADNFYGYEIAIRNNELRIGKHARNFQDISTLACSAPSGKWNNLRVVMTANTMTVYVNGVLVRSYTDPNPFETGEIGLRSYNSNARYKNIQFAKDGGPLTPIVIKSFNEPGESLSGRWDVVHRGSAEGAWSVDLTTPYKGGQSQLVEFVSGTGAIGISNKGLNRKGLNYEADKEYEGFFYAKSPSPVTAYAVFESADGSVKYGEAAIPISGDNKWARYDFTAVSNIEDTAGRFTIELRDKGILDLGYFFLQPGSWGRYKGLPLRKDVAELMVTQGVSVLRFGGSAVNTKEYRWKNMIGPVEERPVMVNGTWCDYTSFGFGIFEMLDMCEAMGIPGIPDVNVNETPDDMADFIDFAKGTDSSNPWVRKRIEMGHPAPYNIPYLQIGNEDVINNDFANKFNAIAEKIWEKDSDIILVVGDHEYFDVNLDPARLAGNEKILNYAIQHGNREVWIDMHFWTRYPYDTYRESFLAAISIYDKLHTMCPGTKLKIPIFELNADSHDFRRALANAFIINRHERYSDIFPITCSANALQVAGHNDNGWNQGLLFMDNDKAWLQPPGYVTQMASKAHQPYTVEFTATPDNTFDLDFTVTISADGKTLMVKAVNLLESERKVRISMKDFTGNTNKVTIRKLIANSDTDLNTRDNLYNVTPVSQVYNNLVQNNVLEITIDPRSYTIVGIEAGN